MYEVWWLIILKICYCIICQFWSMNTVFFSIHQSFENIVWFLTYKDKLNVDVFARDISVLDVWHPIQRHFLNMASGTACVEVRCVQLFFCWRRRGWRASAVALARLKLQQKNIYLFDPHIQLHKVCYWVCLDV